MSMHATRVGLIDKIFGWTRNTQRKHQYWIWFRVDTEMGLVILLSLCSVNSGAPRLHRRVLRGLGSQPLLPLHSAPWLSGCPARCRRCRSWTLRLSASRRSCLTSWATCRLVSSPPPSLAVPPPQAPPSVHGSCFFGTCAWHAWQPHEAVARNGSESETCQPPREPKLATLAKLLFSLGVPSQYR